MEVSNPPADTAAPEPTITSEPKNVLRTRTRRKRVTYEFSSSETGSNFECSRDGESFTPCTSPVSFRVRVGRHTFEVRAIDMAGNADVTPERDAFRLRRRRSR